MRIITMGVALALAAGCVAEQPESDEGVVVQEIVGGNEAVPGQWSSVVALDYLLDNKVHHCAGNYIAPGWVLTAAHCVVDTRPEAYLVIADEHDIVNGQSGTYVAVKNIIRHPGWTGQAPVPGADNDIALVELAEHLAIPTMPLAGKYEGLSLRVGEAGMTVGWGRTSASSSASPVLREVAVDVIGTGAACQAQTGYVGVTDNMLCMGSNLAPRTCRGDSGAPAMVRRGNEWVQIGINSLGGPQCNEPNLPDVFTFVPNYRDWIWQEIHRGATRFTPTDHAGRLQHDLVFTSEWGSSLFRSDDAGNWTLADAWPDLPFLESDVTPGDFNGDGFGDLMIATPLGSFLHTSFADGTYDIPYARPDLPLGAVRYVPADFDGDGCTDLVVTDKSGSYWYYGQKNGTFVEKMRRTDLPLGVVDYVVGNFDGNAYEDLVITTPTGSYWYFSNGDGTFHYPYIRNDLPLGRVAYTPGDFDNNGKTDLVITTATGSYWYFSKGDGTWWWPYIRSDLPLGRVRYTPVDLDGNLRTDLVITTMTGSYGYLSNGSGGFTAPWQRSDLPLGIARYVPGYFDVDANEDLVITTPTGSYWYHSNGDGTFRTGLVRSDLPL